MDPQTGDMRFTHTLLGLDLLHAPGKLSIVVVPNSSKKCDGPQI